jgi:hypothetical protein
VIHDSSALGASDIGGPTDIGGPSGLPEAPVGGPIGGDRGAQEGPISERVGRDPGNLGDEVPTGADVVYPSPDAGSERTSGRVEM